MNFSCPMGGVWNTKGRSHDNGDGTFTETFSGKVTDASACGTYTQANFGWLIDGWYLCNPSHTWIKADAFSLTIDARGNVSGWATYRR